MIMKLVSKQLLAASVHVPISKTLNCKIKLYFVYPRITKEFIGTR